MSSVIYIPDKKNKPENINDAIPKPLLIKKSLVQAPNLFNQFCVFTSLDAISESVLWSA